AERREHCPHLLARSWSYRLRSVPSASSARRHAKAGKGDRQLGHWQGRPRYGLGRDAVSAQSGFMVMSPGMETPMSLSALEAGPWAKRSGRSAGAKSMLWIRDMSGTCGAPHLDWLSGHIGAHTSLWRSSQAIFTRTTGHL